MIIPVRKSLPTANAVHTDRPLTNMSEAFIQSQDGFVAGRVFPVVQVDKQSDTYYKFDRTYFNRDEMKVRAPGAESEGNGYGLSTGSYGCKVYAYHHDIPMQVEANADAPLNSKRNAMQLVTMKGLIKREKLWATNYFATGKWTTEVTPGTLWDDNSSDPVGDVSDKKRTVRQLTGFEPNKLVFGRAVYDALKNHPDIVARISGMAGPGNPAIVTRQTMAAVFEVEEILVMNAIETTTDEGAATQSSDFIGGKHALLVHAAPTPGLEIPSGGYTFAWRGYLGQNAANGQAIESWYIRERKSTRVEIEMAFDIKQTAADLGAFFLSAVS